VKVADPTFIGYCVEKNADCGGRILLLKLAKCVPKLSPEEASGVICLKNNKFNVIEYSEIDPALSKLTTSEGKLVYNAGNFLLIIANIANHFYTTEFLKKVNLFEGELEYHIAKKKITHVNSEGNVIKYLIQAGETNFKQWNQVRIIHFRCISIY
jgi:UDP-N-acetylglucosamine/UDP-N-acetylgalactosamine diphosphorylase